MAAKFGPALIRNKTLTELDLSANVIDAATTVIIANAVVFHEPFIRTLGICDNPIGACGARALSRMLGDLVIAQENRTFYDSKKRKSRSKKNGKGHAKKSGLDSNDNGAPEESESSSEDDAFIPRALATRHWKRPVSRRACLLRMSNCDLMVCASMPNHCFVFYHSAPAGERSIFTLSPS
jgi:hypothetical protein